jgi:RNA polymerase sigma-70 factor (ECF subfamily)
MDTGVRDRLPMLDRVENPDAFPAVVDRYYRPICAFIFKCVQQYDLVEDLAQETFLEAFRAVRDGVRPDHFSSWLFGIAHNRCGKWLRRRRPLLFASGKGPERALEDPALNAAEEREAVENQLKALDAGLENLPEDARRLLEMKHKRGLT